MVNKIYSKIIIGIGLGIGIGIEMVKEVDVQDKEIIVRMEIKMVVIMGNIQAQLGGQVILAIQI